MKLIIEQNIFDKFPDVVLGVAVLRGVNNSGESEEVGQLLRETEEKAVSSLGSKPIVEQPFVLTWREAYRKFGAKPSDYPSSIENLLRRELKGEQVRHINKLVDIYNVISLKYLVPVGGEDLDKIKGDVLLTSAGENEPAIFLLGEKESRPPHVGEVIYKDNEGAICRRWNWKEADRTKLTEETIDAVLVIEGLPPVFRETISSAVEDLAGMVRKYCGGEVSTDIIDRNNPNIKLI